MKVRIKKTRNHHPMPQITEQQLNEVDIGSFVELILQHRLADSVMLTQTIAAGGIAALAIAIPYIQDMVGKQESKEVQDINNILQDVGMPKLGSGAYDEKPDKALENARKELQAMKAKREKA